MARDAGPKPTQMRSWSSSWGVHRRAERSNEGIMIWAGSGLWLLQLFFKDFKDFQGFSRCYPVLDFQSNDRLKENGGYLD